MKISISTAMWKQSVRFTADISPLVLLVTFPQCRRCLLKAHPLWIMLQKGDVCGHGSPLQCNINVGF